MIGTLAETSHRYRSLLVGEDLGYVPPGFRETMAEAGILAYRPLYFEKRGDAFAPAQDYQPLALACLSTHDLPTLVGWWEGRDIALREENGLITPETAAEQTATRERERHALAEACRNAGALLTNVAVDGPFPETVIVAAHRFIAKTPSRLAAARLADLLGGGEATNVPGTIDTYPNWRPKAPVAIEELQASPLFRAATRAMAEERPRCAI
jgi:4-alpha-glucanotransferase